MTYWYNNGIPDSVALQTDVFSFKCFGGGTYTGVYDTTIVDSIVYRGSRRDEANDVFFNVGSTLPQRINATQNMYATGQIEIVYLNVSRNPFSNYSTDEWFTIDNLILVNFSNPYPSSTYIQNFMDQYDLTLHYEPLAGLPVTTGCSYTYIFEADVKESNTGVVDYEYFAELMQDMYLNASGGICEVGPNIVNHRARAEEGPNNPTPPASPVYPICGSGSPNDTWADYEWYVKNDGFNEQDFAGGAACPSPGVWPADGTIGADAKICDCWSAGLSGTGVRVGVIGRGDIFIGHEDLGGQQFLDRFDCTNHPCTLLAPSTSSTGVGFHMIGIIAATKNNNKGIAGISDACTIVPFKIGDDFSSDADMVAALQQALAQSIIAPVPRTIHILALDYFSPIESGSIKTELYKHHKDGRPIDHGQKIGTIIIAPAGHTTVSTTGTIIPQFPAKYDFDAFFLWPEVIGVINSNRYDKLETGEGSACFPPYAPGFVNYSHPSNLNSTYDIGAPASQFFSLYGLSYLRGKEEYQSADAVAVTTGVTALLLQDKPNQTDIQMRDRLRAGANKVNQPAYVYNAAGRSMEMAHGRINCIQSLNYTPTKINEIAKNTLFATVVNGFNCWTVIFESATQSKMNCEVYNSQGQLVKNIIVPNGLKEFAVLNENYASGIYLIKLSTSNESVSLKAIK